VTGVQTCALPISRAQLRHRDVGAVKVVRHRSMVSDFTLQTVVFEQQRENAAVNFGVSDYSGPFPACQTYTDFLDLEARSTIRRLLRPFLDKHRATPLELVHTLPTLRRLMDHGDVLLKAVGRVAQAQAAGLEMAPRDRMKQLFAILDANRVRLERAMSDKPGPIDETLLAETHDLDAEGDWDSEAIYTVTLRFSLMLASRPAFTAKYEKLVSLAEGDLSPLMVKLVDRALADCLMTQDVIRMVVGEHPTMAAFLGSLLDILLPTDLGETRKPTKDQLALRILLQSGRFPESRFALDEALLSHLESDRPLDKRDLNAEPGLLKELLTRLMLGDQGFYGDTRTVKAIELRNMAIRKRTLRKMGMEDAADAVERRESATILD